MENSEDIEVNLENWEEGKGYEFKDEEAEQKYKERARRVRRAIDLEEPDRTPVFINTGFFPAFYAGISAEEAMHDPEKMGDAFKKFVFDFEPDVHTTSPVIIPNGRIFEALDYQLYRWPGHGTSPDTSYQCVEGEYMEPEDYDKLIQDPSDFWLRTYLGRICGELEPFEKLSPLTDIIELPSIPAATLPFGMPDVQSALKSLMEAGEESLKWQQEIGKVIQEITALGFPLFLDGLSKAPYDVLGDTLRGSRGVMLDMKRRPEKLLEAMDRLTPLMIKLGVSGAKATGIPIVFMPLHKGADGFMSDEEYKKFYWPFLKRVIQGIIDEGLVPWVFAEGAYNQRLEVLKNDHPDGRVIWHFDQTDMEDAKEMIGDRICIMGNVPSSLIQTGTPEKVRDYCEDLIDKVGSEGFILNTGAVVDQAKPENLKAMVNTVKE